MVKWLSALIGVCYVVLGVFVIIYKYFVIELEQQVAYALGLLLIVYGIYRVYRGIKKNRARYEN